MKHCIFLRFLIRPIVMYKLFILRTLNISLLVYNMKKLKREINLILFIIIINFILNLNEYFKPHGLTS